MHSSRNTAAPLRSLSIDMHGEILLRQTVAGQVDTFIIRPEHDPIQRCDIPQCYLLHPDSQCLSRLYHYPLSLSDVVTRRHQSSAWRQYYPQLDHSLVEKLLTLSMDSLRTYALLKGHPPLHRHWINAPVSISRKASPAITCTGCIMRASKRPRCNCDFITWAGQN